MVEPYELVDRWRKLQEDLVLQYNDLGLATLAAMTAGMTIDVAPQFQRRDRWSTTKQSELIESFILNLPVPPIYLSEEDGGTYSVIDGRQRLTAIRAFFEDELTLVGLSELPELNGFKFSSLPETLQGSLSMRPLRSATLLRQTMPELKYLVFHRLNTAGEPLNAQEIRNVFYRGPLNDLLFELASAPFLRIQLKIESDKSSAFRKMQDVEFVLRFLTLNEVWTRFSGNLARSMDEFMAHHRGDSREQLNDLAVGFRLALADCEALWGEHAFHRPDGQTWRNQALAGLFDAQMTSASRLERSEVTALTERRAEVLAGTRELFENPLFDEAVRIGTNTPSRVKLRIEMMSTTLSQILETRSQ